MNQLQMYNLLVLVVSSIFFFHCVGARGAHQQQSVVNEEQENSNTQSLKRESSLNKLLNDNRRRHATAMDILNGKGKLPNNGPIPQDNIIQQTNVIPQPQDNIIQKGSLKKKCKEGNDKCSAIESIVESYRETVEKNAETFKKVNKNIEELIKIVSDSKGLCDQDNENEDISSEVSTTTKSTPSRRTRGTTSTTTESSLAHSEEEDENPAPGEENQNPGSEEEDDNPAPGEENQNPESEEEKADQKSTEASQPVYLTFTGKETETAKLKCNPKNGETIYIIDAYYGAADLSKCPPTPYGPVTREAGDRKAAIRSLCGIWTQSRCEFPITGSSLGDSCKGVSKTLRVSYACSLPGVLSMAGN